MRLQIYFKQGIKAFHNSLKYCIPTFICEDYFVLSVDKVVCRD